MSGTYVVADEVEVGDLFVGFPGLPQSPTDPKAPAPIVSIQGHEDRRFYIEQDGVVSFRWCRHDEIVEVVR